MQEEREKARKNSSPICPLQTHPYTLHHLMLAQARARPLIYPRKKSLIMTLTPNLHAVPQIKDTSSHSQRQEP